MLAAHTDTIVSKKRLLYIEDEAIIALNQKKIFEKHGYEVVYVSSGEQALTIIDNSAEHFDVIVSDIDLGEGCMKGTDAAKKILKRHTIPIVFLTSHTEKAMVAQAESITNYGYVIKNSGEAVLIETLKHALALFAVMQELTRELAERERVEAALQESESRYHDFFATARDSVFITAENGDWIDFNDFSLEMFGYASREEFTKITITSLYANSQDRAEVLRQIEENGYIYEYPVQFRRKDGMLIEALITAGFRKKIHGSGKEYYGTIRDITSRKCAEERIQTLLAEKNILLKEVHHRIKNNMMVIISQLNLRREGITDVKAMAAFENAINTLDCTMTLYDKLYRSEGYLTIPFAEFIPPLVNEILSVYADAVTRDKLKTQIEYDDVDLDSNILRPLGIIINELITNVIKYAFQGRENTENILKISFRYNKTGRRVTLSLADNGIGLPKNFDFNTLSSSGLILVYSLVQQLKGTLTHPSSAEGTKFIIEFNI